MPPPRSRYTASMYSLRCQWNVVKDEMDVDWLTARHLCWMKNTIHCGRLSRDSTQSPKWLKCVECDVKPYDGASLSVTWLGRASWLDVRLKRFPIHRWMKVYNDLESSFSRESASALETLTRAGRAGDTVIYISIRQVALSKFLWTASHAFCPDLHVYKLLSGMVDADVSALFVANSVM